MKKWMVIGILGVMSLLVGAVVLETATDNRTVGTWSLLVSEYIEAREKMPPLPLNTEAVLAGLAR